jgi:hypothetical protein
LGKIITTTPKIRLAIPTHRPKAGNVIAGIRISPPFLDSKNIDPI